MVSGRSVTVSRRRRGPHRRGLAAAMLATVSLEMAGADVVVDVVAAVGAYVGAAVGDAVGAAVAAVALLLALTLA